MKQLLYNEADVRDQLYKVRNDIQGRKKEHIGKSRETFRHTRFCLACNYWNAQMAGIDQAITHFGGRPRR